MTERILRDIRYSEKKPQNYHGAFDGILGNVFIQTPDTKFIGQRIARKLNELGFVSGRFDHIYIRFNTELNDGDILSSDNYGDDRIASYDYGISRQEFNDLPRSEKDSRTIEITFEVLRSIFKNEEEKLDQLRTVHSLILEQGRDIRIHYKTKETKDYKVDILYQIMSTTGTSLMLVEHLNKLTNQSSQFSFNLNFHEDIYSLVKSILVKKDTIIFTPFDTNYAKMALANYKTPLTIELYK